MKTCPICSKPAFGRGLCKNHYRSFLKYGNPIARSNARGLPFEGRYEVATNGCWLWTKGVNTCGYGTWVAYGQQTAHRASYVKHKGPIPDELHVLHKCDTPACVNPDHLFLGTHQDNMADLRAKGRAYGAKGEENFGAKLIESQVMEIMRDPREAQLIATEYGVSAAAVGAIRNGHTWKHLFSDSVRQKRIAAGCRVHLTDAQKTAIANDPRIQIEIAAEYGINQGRVSLIKRTWAKE